MELPVQGLAEVSVCRSRTGDKPAFSGAEGWGTEMRLAADLKAMAARSSATCDFLSHKSWPADLARLSEDTRSSLQSTAVTLLSPGAQIS